MINKKFLKLLKHKYVISILILVVSSVLIILLNIIYEYEKKIENEMFKVSTSDVFEITQHKAAYIKNMLLGSDDFIKVIVSNEKIRKTLEKNIENLITKNIKYSYIVYKDKNNVFRFLVDGSAEDEKSMLNQKFDVTSKIWFEIYEEKKPMIIEHNVLQKLSISYLVPVINKQDVELILVIDFSIDKISAIVNIITMMKTGIIVILSFIAVTFLILIIQFIRFKSVKKTSFIDRLTNVYNRNYLHEIEEDIKLDEYTLTVLDLDFFKNINDTYGHDIGDVVLKEVGSILINTLRIEEDLAIRYGGEEFILLIKNKSSDPEQSIGVVERIFNNIKTHKFFIDDENYIQITTSMGINPSPGNYNTFMDAFKVADLALFEAKNSGRNNIKYSKDV